MVYMKKLFVIMFSALCASPLSVFPEPPSGYYLLWSDEFNGTSLDTTIWTFDTGTGENGWGNGEKEYYTKGANLEFANGAMAIVAKKEDKSGMSYTSSRIHSQGKKEFKYGYFEVKLKSPEGKGLWPAFWMLGADFNNPTKWPVCGEAEIFETLTGPNGYNGLGDNAFIGTCHHPNPDGTGVKYNTGKYTYTEKLSLKYHLYAIKWDKTSIQYFFDGNKFWEYSITASYLTMFHQKFFFIANVAVGGNYQGDNIDNSIFPQKMYIDYIRVYSDQPVNVVSTPASPVQGAMSLAHPATARLIVYNVHGKRIGDFSSRIRSLQSGDNATLALRGVLLPGAYIVRCIDLGKSNYQKMIFTK
jgi:beta-glucanase (GH16 family)